jgi:homoserine dehydrogenase
MAGRLPYVMFDAKKKTQNRFSGKVVLRHYLRFSAADRPGVMAAVTQLISKHNISISSVHQEDTTLTDSGPVKKFVPIVIVTHEAPEGAVQAAMKESRRIRGLSRSPVHLRIESLG